MNFFSTIEAKQLTMVRMRWSSLTLSSIRLSMSSAFPISMELKYCSNDACSDNISVFSRSLYLWNFPSIFKIEVACNLMRRNAAISLPMESFPVVSVWVRRCLSFRILRMSEFLALNHLLCQILCEKVALFTFSCRFSAVVSNISSIAHSMTWPSFELQ